MEWVKIGETAPEIPDGTECFVRWPSGRYSSYIWLKNWETFGICSFKELTYYAIITDPNTEEAK